MDEYSNLLASIHAAMQGDPGYKFIDPGDGEVLTARGLVEINPTIVDDDGDVAARLTPSGIWAVENEGKETELAKANEVAVEPQTDIVEAEQDANVETVANAPVALETGAIVDYTPKVKTRKASGPRKPKYDFENLEIGKGIFVAGKTAKELGSSVRNANKLYSELTGETKARKIGGRDVVVPMRKPLRKFEAEDVEGGAVIGRIAID